MKSFKDFQQKLNEGGEYYPADGMTMDELKIACNSAENIIGMLERGSMIQRWQISAIVKASDELASVYTSMRVDADEMEDEIADYEYPMMGEEVELDEANINDMNVSAEMKSLLQMRNIASSGSKSPRLLPIKKEKQDLSKEIGKVINQLKRKEEGKTSKYDSMLPDLVKQYNAVTEKMNKLGGGKFPYQPPSEFTDGRKNIKEYAELDESILEALEEAATDDFRKQLIQKAVEEYAEGKKDIRGVSISKIVDAYASKKNFGNNTIDKLEDELGLPDGVIIRLAKAVKEELKANMSSSSGSQSQSQRIDRFLKQKWVKK